MSKNRDCYFQKYCKRAPTPEAYIKALIDSPFKTHRRMALLLIPELDRLIAEQETSLRREELNKFEETLRI